jgi:hypothetical protein
MLLLYCADPLSRRRPDESYADEVTAATAAGLEHALIRLEALVDEDDAEQAVASVPASTSTRLGVYRGWMLRPPQYARLYEALLQHGIRLINNPDGYVACHLFPASYDRIAGLTPRSVWLPMASGSPWPDWGILGQLLRPFGDQPVVVKDYVKSRKHEWENACYIPDASDQGAVERVVKRFLDLQGPDLEGGLVFRAFVRFVPIGVHSKSGMPLTREYRIFWLDGEPLALAPYWELPDDDGGDDGQRPEPLLFRAVAASIGSRFFTMDVAQRQDDGAWQIVELGDAQVAGLPERLDVGAFYTRLRDALELE